jgi:ADP-ribose pyrophosphatase YjhB (NUDIX family)
MASLDPAFRFCPACGGPLEPRQLKAGDPMRPVCARCGYVHYLDPKVAVGTVIVTGDDKIVLVRRAIEPGYGLWVFPGGYVDRGEEVTVAAIREAREESGLDVRLDGLINIYSYPGRPIVVVVYKAAICRLMKSHSKQGSFLGTKFHGFSWLFGARARRWRTSIPGLSTPSADCGFHAAVSKTQSNRRDPRKTAHIQRWMRWYNSGSSSPDLTGVCVR